MLRANLKWILSELNGLRDSRIGLKVMERRPDPSKKGWLGPRQKHGDRMLYPSLVVFFFACNDYGAE